MENLHTRFSWKVWVLVLIILAGILLILLVYPLFFEQRNSSMIPTNSFQNNPIPTSLPEDELPVERTWDEYDAQIFRLQKPTVWTIESKPISGVGWDWTLASPSTAGLNHTIEIQRTNSPQITVESLSALFSTFGYRKQVKSISGLEATFFTGNTGNLQESVVIFRHKGWVYKIMNIYTSSTRSPQADKIFETVISSFTLL